MSQATRRLRRHSRRPEPPATIDWRWTRHAMRRMQERWPQLGRCELEAALGRGRVLQRRAARYDLLVLLPDYGLAIFIVDHGAVVTGYPAHAHR